MKSALESLSRDSRLFEQVTKQLDVKDRLSLSLTCWHLRMVLGAEFLETAVLRNNVRSGETVKALGRSRAAELVRTLWYEGVAPTDTQEGYEDLSMLMPNVVHWVLANLSCFPKLDKISVGFDFMLEQEHWQLCLFCMSEQPDSEITLEKESRHGWLMLMARTLEALVQNREKGMFKTLQLRDLYPRTVSTFYNPAFRELLSHVNCFDLTLWGQERTGAKRHSNQLGIKSGYLDFVQSLDWSIFFHLTNVTSFKFAPSRSAIMLGQSLEPLLWSDICFPLDGAAMRRLKHLHLGNVFVTLELIDFVLSHVFTLESLVLRGCSAYAEATQDDDDNEDGNDDHDDNDGGDGGDGDEDWEDEEDDDDDDDDDDNSDDDDDDDGEERLGPAWSELFDAISECKAPCLKRLEIAFLSPDEVREHADSTPLGGEEADYPHRASAQLSKMLEAEQSRPVFSYGSLDDKGVFSQEWCYIWQQWKDGRDQDAYERLLGLVLANSTEAPLRIEMLSAPHGPSLAKAASRPANEGDWTPQGFIYDD